MADVCPGNSDSSVESDRDSLEEKLLTVRLKESLEPLGMKEGGPARPWRQETAMQGWLWGSSGEPFLIVLWAVWLLGV